ncbi:hypothetical protein [Lysinibacillus sp. 38-6]|uniref:hypothetical protein n=1 Tax=Lysinibacillus sp. 38-6 TaxID=3385991 RepID=UPI003908B7A6
MHKKATARPEKSPEEQLLQEIQQIITEDGQLYNGAQLYDKLKKRGFQGSLRKVQRVLKKAKEAPVEEVREPVVNSGFETTTANDKWVINISYVPTWHQGWVYMASVIDVHTKKLTGFSFDHSINEGLFVQALQKAYDQFAMPSVLYTSLQPKFIEHCKEACRENDLTLPAIVFKDYGYDDKCLQAMVPFLTGTENRLRRGHASISKLQ